MDLPPGSSFAVAAAPPRAVRGFRALWIASALLPALAVTGAGFATWDAVQREAGARLARTVELLRENALRALGTQEAILAATARVMAGREPDQLRQDVAFHLLLEDLAKSGAPAISGVVVTDGAGRIVSASYEFPARPADLSDRDYIQALWRGGQQRVLGEPVTARPMGWQVIPVARRTPVLDGDEEAAGAVVSSFNPAALAEFYASVTENPRDVVALFRDDGAVLVRHPPVPGSADPAVRARAAALLGTLTGAGGGAAWVDSALDGRRRLFVARRLGDWPAVIAHGADRETLLAAWRGRMMLPAASGVFSMGLLLALTALAERGARLQRQQAEGRAEAEAQLARAGRAASLGLLSAGLAHDIKNLVQSVRSGARVMDRSAEDPAEVRHCARLLADAADRGGRLVEAMLSFARSGAETGERGVPLDIRAALLELTELLTRTLGSGWRVRSELPLRLPPASGDRAGYEAAVVNLAANARDAMPEGGTVTICARETVLEEAVPSAGLKPGHYVITSVRDTGAGMDEETLARLGEPFFTTKPPGAGTGLGLATVRGFCARTGGALRIDSTPGRGTAAEIWLPAA